LDLEAFKSKNKTTSMPALSGCHYRVCFRIFVYCFVFVDEVQEKEMSLLRIDEFFEFEKGARIKVHTRATVCVLIFLRFYLV
jgi:hypothetical protein